MIFYICDRKACGEECPNPECKHTTDIFHAKNFKEHRHTIDVEHNKKFKRCEEPEYRDQYWEEVETDVRQTEGM